MINDYVCYICKEKRNNRPVKRRQGASLDESLTLTGLKRDLSNIRVSFLQENIPKTIKTVFMLASFWKTHRWTNGLAGIHGDRLERDTQSQTQVLETV